MTSKTDKSTILPGYNGAREDFRVSKGPEGDEKTLLVSVNGYNCVVPRGKTVNVPSFVADELRRSLAAQDRLDETIDRLLAAAKAPADA